MPSKKLQGVSAGEASIAGRRSSQTQLLASDDGAMPKNAPAWVSFEPVNGAAFDAFEVGALKAEDSPSSQPCYTARQAAACFSRCLPLPYLLQLTESFDASQPQPNKQRHAIPGSERLAFHPPVVNETPTQALKGIDFSSPQFDISAIGLPVGDDARGQRAQGEREQRDGDLYYSVCE